MLLSDILDAIFVIVVQIPIVLFLPLILALVFAFDSDKERKHKAIIEEREYAPHFWNTCFFKVLSVFLILNIIFLVICNVISATEEKPHGGVIQVDESVEEDGEFYDNEEEW